MKEQLRASPEKYPEFDAVGIWRSIIEDHATHFTRALPAEKLQQMPLFLAEISRGIYAGGSACTRTSVRCSTSCATLPPRDHHRRAEHVARGELHKVGLLGYFDPIIVSGDHGYREPDRRLFQFALDGMGVAARNCLYVGNDVSVTSTEHGRQA